MLPGIAATQEVSNASEVLRAGLRLLERQEQEDAARLVALRDAAERGWADLAAGRYDDVSNDELSELVRRLGRLATES